MLRQCPRLALRGSPLGPVSLNFLLGALGRPPRVTTNQGPRRVLGSQTQLLAHTTRANLLSPRYKHTRFPGRPQRPEKNQKVSTSRGSAPAPLGPPGQGCDQNPAQTRPRPRRRPSGPFSPLTLLHQRLRPEGPETRSTRQRSSAPGWGPTYGGVWCSVVVDRQIGPHAHVCVRAHVLSGEPALHSRSPEHTDVSSFRDQAGQAATGRARTPRLGEIGWPSQGHWDDRRRCWAHGATLNEPKRMGGRRHTFRHSSQHLPEALWWRRQT